jgi:hypothetical protein
MAWDKVELVLGSVDRPTLTHSRLMLTLEGGLYETSNRPKARPALVGQGIPDPNGLPISPS